MYWLYISSPENFAGDMYLCILNTFFVPDFKNTVRDDESIWFMQDGAPVHTARATPEYLKDLLWNQIVGRHFEIE